MYLSQNSQYPIQLRELNPWTGTISFTDDRPQLVTVFLRDFQSSAKNEKKKLRMLGSASSEPILILYHLFSSDAASDNFMLRTNLRGLHCGVEEHVQPFVSSVFGIDEKEQVGYSQKGEEDEG